ncbi:hypothetical protein Dimus_028304 [Dionaea muscipula]
MYKCPIEEPSTSTDHKQHLKAKMAQWSAENAAKAYLRTLKMGKGAKEPDVSEFVSAIAAGSNAKLMVVASSGRGPAYTTSAIMQALVVAAHQTGGRVICIIENNILLGRYRDAGDDPHVVEYVTGDVQRLINDDYKEADFVAIDCKLEKNHEKIIGEVIRGRERNRAGTATVLGYNAFFSSSSSSWQWGGSRTQLLPIGDGLLITRIVVADAKTKYNVGSPRRNNNWVVKVDKIPGRSMYFGLD